MNDNYNDFDVRVNAKNTLLHMKSVLGKSFSAGDMAQWLNAHVNTVYYHYKKPAAVPNGALAKEILEKCANLHALNPIKFVKVNATAVKPVTPVL